MEETPQEQLKQLETEYLEKRAVLENKAAEQADSSTQEQKPSEHETMSQIVEEKIQQQVPEFQAASHAPRSSEDVLPPDAQARVEEWVAMAKDKGDIDGAVKAAKTSGDAALIDAFHAALTGELYQTLVEQKKLEQVN